MQGFEETPLYLTNVRLEMSLAAETCDRKPFWTEQGAGCDAARISSSSLVGGKEQQDERRQPQHCRNGNTVSALESQALDLQNTGITAKLKLLHLTLFMWLSLSKILTHTGT